MEISVPGSSPGREVLSDFDSFPSSPTFVLDEGYNSSDRLLRTYIEGPAAIFAGSCFVSTTETQKWIAEINEWQKRLEPRFPDIDPHDLRMILRSLLQPPSVPRHWLLRKTKDARYVL